MLTYIRNYYYHFGGASASDLVLSVTFPEQVLVREFHSAWNIDGIQFLGGGKGGGDFTHELENVKQALFLHL